MRSWKNNVRAHVSKFFNRTGHSRRSRTHSAMSALPPKAIEWLACRDGRKVRGRDIGGAFNHFVGIGKYLVPPVSRAVLSSCRRSEGGGARRSRFLGPEFITDPGTKDVSAEAYCFRDARHDVKENAAAKIGVQKFELSRQPW